MTSAGAGTGARKLLLTEPTHSAGYLPVYMGQQRGYFAEEGLDAAMHGESAYELGV